MISNQYNRRHIDRLKKAIWKIDKSNQFRCFLLNGYFRRLKTCERPID